MTDRPNFLVLMCDQIQARAVYDDMCHTPNIDALRSRGISFTRAYTPNAVCSPARASLMTGKLPHNHNVLWVTHTMNPEHVRLRQGLPHFAQDLVRAGYRTSYVGKWHVEPDEKPGLYGWQTDRSEHSGNLPPIAPRGELSDEVAIDGPEGYRRSTLAGVTRVPPEQRAMGVIVETARDELRTLANPGKHPGEPNGGQAPWCLFVSVPEPHDPYVVGADAHRAYDGWTMEQPANWRDTLERRPRIYQRIARAFAGLTDEQRMEAARCYYASVTEIDGQFGRILADLEERGLADDTVIVLVTDHGDFLGAHGVYCKNVGAWEEAYNVPLIITGPRVARGEHQPGPGGLTSVARVGTHALFPSLLAHYGIPSQIECDAPLFDDVLAASADEDVESAIRRADAAHDTGLAEYFGVRLMLTQRVFYRDRWKLVWNGFDDHEFYDLASDPWELENLAGADGPALDPAHDAGKAYRETSAAMWAEIRRTGDHTLVNSHYVGLRVSDLGPGE